MSFDSILVSPCRVGSSSSLKEADPIVARSPFFDEFSTVSFQISNTFLVLSIDVSEPEELFDSSSDITDSMTASFAFALESTEESSSSSNRSVGFAQDRESEDLSETSDGEYRRAVISSISLSFGLSVLLIFVSCISLS